MAGTGLSSFDKIYVGGVSIAPQTVTTATTTNGSGVDMQLSDGPVTMEFHFGTLSDHTLTVNAKIQESDTSGGTYTDMNGVPVSITQITGTDGGVAAQVVALTTNQRTKRWVRAQLVTAGGGTLSCPVSAAVFAEKKIAGSGPGNVL